MVMVAGVSRFRKEALVRALGMAFVLGGCVESSPESLSEPDASVADQDVGGSTRLDAAVVGGEEPSKCTGAESDPEWRQVGRQEFNGEVTFFHEMTLRHREGCVGYSLELRHRSSDDGISQSNLATLSVCNDCDAPISAVLYENSRSREVADSDILRFLTSVPYGLHASGVEALNCDTLEAHHSVTCGAYGSRENRPVETIYTVAPGEEMSADLPGHVWMPFWDWRHEWELYHWDALNSPYQGWDSERGQPMDYYASDLYEVVAYLPRFSVDALPAVHPRLSVCMDQGYPYFEGCLPDGPFEPSVGDQGEAPFVRVTSGPLPLPPRLLDSLRMRQDLVKSWAE
jgi:hypothetical protein